MSIRTFWPTKMHSSWQHDSRFALRRSAIHTPTVLADGFGAPAHDPVCSGTVSTQRAIRLLNRWTATHAYAPSHFILFLYICLILPHISSVFSIFGLFYFIPLCFIYCKLSEPHAPRISALVMVMHCFMEYLTTQSGKHCVCLFTGKCNQGWE